MVLSVFEVYPIAKLLCIVLLVFIVGFLLTLPFAIIAGESDERAGYK